MKNDAYRVNLRPSLSIRLAEKVIFHSLICIEGADLKSPAENGILEK